MTVLILVIGAWLVCGVIGAGYVYAYFQREYPMFADRDRRVDSMTAVLAILGGPSTLLTLAISRGMFSHGWLFPGRHP